MLNAGAVIVSCTQTMSPNPLTLVPQDWSDCPEIPAQHGLSSFKSGTYPAYCDDCDWERHYYCATARCSLKALPSRPNMVHKFSKSQYNVALLSMYTRILSSDIFRQVISNTWYPTEDYTKYGNYCI